MRFDSPTQILHGAGTRHELAGLLQGLGCKRVLLVTDKFLVQNQMIEPFAEALRAASLAVAVFSEVQPDPTLENVAQGRQAFRTFAADSVVAVGGGSSIDCAKAIRFEERYVPLIAVPTTAGTGSEATKVIVITDTGNGVKKMTLDPRLMPDIAVVDFELSLTMPRPLTAHVGVDTLTHGIEAYVSRKASELTDALARSCIQLCGRYLFRAWADGSDRDARAGMSIAALEGGMAFTNSSVALVHGMSRPLGALFHIPHGLSNALLLPTLTRYSWPGAPQRYAEVAQILGIVPDRATFAGWLESLNRELEIPRLRDCCGDDWDRFESLLPKMAGDALASGSPANNPRVPAQAEIEELYRAAW